MNRYTKATIAILEIQQKKLEINELKDIIRKELLLSEIESHSQPCDESLMLESIDELKEIGIKFEKTSFSGHDLVFNNIRRVLHTNGKEENIPNCVYTHLLRRYIQ